MDRPQRSWHNPDTMLCSRIAALILLTLLVGCGPLTTRNPVPLRDIDSATIPGYAHVRFWGDVIDAGLQRSFENSWEQERAERNARHEGDTIAPEASFLAISGGGENGAYGAGVLCGWTQAGNRPNFKIVTGISTGALIGPLAFLGPAYDAQLKKVYTTVNMDDVAVLRGFVDLLRGDSAYNTAPLVRLVKQNFTHQMIDQIAIEHRKGRRLFVGTTNLDAQRPVVWDMGAIACSNRSDRDDLFRNVLLASAAIPGAFSPVYLHVVTPDGKTYDELHVDGGVTREMFLTPSELHLIQLRDAYGGRARSHLYVIRNSRLEPEYDSIPPKIAPIAARAVYTLIKAQSMGDILQMYDQAMASGMTFQLASIPPDLKDTSKSMFDSKYMTALFNRGYDLSRAGHQWQQIPDSARRPSSTTHPATRP